MSNPIRLPVPDEAVTIRLTPALLSALAFLSEKDLEEAGVAFDPALVLHAAYGTPNDRCFCMGVRLWAQTGPDLVGLVCGIAASALADDFIWDADDAVTGAEGIAQGAARALGIKVSGVRRMGSENPDITGSWAGPAICGLTCWGGAVAATTAMAVPDLFWDFAKNQVFGDEGTDTKLGDFAKMVMATAKAAA